MNPTRALLKCTVLFLVALKVLKSFLSDLQKKEESENKRKKEVNLVISHAPSADNSNLSADGDDSFISVEMDSAMPSPFSEVRFLTTAGV